MLALVQKYSAKSTEEWTPIFYRILQSKIRDWYRKSKSRSKWMSFLHFRPQHDDSETGNMIDEFADPVASEPSQTVADKTSIDTLETAIHALPLRQQQAFLLRSWEGLSVAETAMAMKCSEGSIKTHYSRALKTLRAALEGHWP
jgi:RNA polymerase sigma-70 factor (ECF subfamily)